MSIHRAVEKNDLEEEANRATKLLGGKIVKRISRHRKEEVTITFADGTHFHIDAEPGGTQEL